MEYYIKAILLCVPPFEVHTRSLVIHKCLNVLLKDIFQSNYNCLWQKELKDRAWLLNATAYTVNLFIVSYFTGLIHSHPNSVLFTNQHPKHQSTARRAAPTDLLSALAQRPSSRQGQSSSSARSETDTGTRWCPTERPPRWWWWHLGGSDRWHAVEEPDRESCCRLCSHPKPPLKTEPFGGDQTHWHQQQM